MKLYSNNALIARLVGETVGEMVVKPVVMSNSASVAPTGDATTGFVFSVPLAAAGKYNVVITYPAFTVTDNSEQEITGGNR